MKDVKVQIKDSVRHILSKGRVENAMYFLPQVQLSREEYLEVNKILELLNGKWSKSKKAHVFPTNEEAQSIVSSLNAGEVVDKKKTYQFFETPMELARKMVVLADIRDNMTILEPSAGHGAIAEVLVENDIQKPVYNCGLILVEIDPDKCAVLEAKKIAPVICIDFLGSFADEYGTFDRILMNPPFTRGQDADHIIHAFEKCLNEGGRLVSVASASVTFNSQKKYKKLRELIEKHGEMIELPKESFKESGTSVNTVLVILNHP